MSGSNWFHVLVSLTVVLSSSLAAQDKQRGLDSVQQSNEPLLPETVVRPPIDPSPNPSVDPALLGREFELDSNLSPSLSETLNGFGKSSGVLRDSRSIFDSAVAGSITSRAQLEEKQATDMFQALENEVGIMMQRTAAGQASPFVRGLTGQQVLILVDGIRLNNSVFRRGPNQYFNTIDPSMVERIEVIRGQGSVLWGGDAIGGVINVVTRGPKFQRDQLGHEFNQVFNTADSSSYSRLNVEGWIGQAGFFGGTSYLNVRDLDTGFDFGRQPGTNYSQYAGDMKFRYLLDSQRLFTVAVQHLEQNNVPRSDRFPGYPGDLDNSNSPGGARFFDPQQRDLFYVRYESLSPFVWIDAMTTTLSYHRQRETQTRGIPTNRFQETDVETVGITVVSVKDLGSVGTMTAGLEWYHDDVDSHFGGTGTGSIVPDDAFYERVGSFVNWDLDLTCSLSISAGIRSEMHETAGSPDINGSSIEVAANYHDWIGHVGFVYALDPCTHLVGSVSEGFRPPNLDDLMANNPNVLQDGQSVPSLGLEPENSATYELGLKTQWDRLQAQAIVYWTDIQDNIVSITSAPDTFASDNQDSYLRGVELNGNYHLKASWSLYGTFWYSYGRNEVTGSPLSRVPPAQGFVGLRWTGCRSYFSVYSWLVGRQDRLDRVRDTTDERIPIGGTPGYGTLNLRFGRTLGDLRQRRVSLNLENITDEDYLVHGSGVYGSGFTMRLGYTWTF